MKPCVGCSTQLADEAVFCSACGRAQQAAAGQPQAATPGAKPAKKMGCGTWVLILLGAPCTLGTCLMLASGGSGSQRREAQAAGAVAASSPAPAPRAEKKTRQVQLGEAFALGHFAYKVAVAEKSNTIGSAYSRKRAPEGASYVVVRYGIRNDGNQTETVMASDMTVRDGKGRTFRTDSGAETALAMSEGHDFILSELQPGITKTTAAAYLVPNDAIESGLTLVVPEKGFLGTGAVEVPLEGPAK
jgi:hypothetical protein